jgi:hypothetical protein
MCADKPHPNKAHERPNEAERENPTMSRKRILGITLIIGILCLAIGGYAELEAYRARKDAESLVADLRSLRVGQSTAAEIQKLPDTHPRFFVKQTSTCNGDVCYFDFGYPTSLLAKLGLASKIILGVRLMVYQGRVDLIILDIVCDAQPRPYGVYVRDMIPDPQDQEGPFLIYNVRGDTTWVRLTSDASKLQRDHAYSLDLKMF